MVNTPPKPPAHLSKTARNWWKSVLEQYDLDEHHVHLLRLACEALTQAEEARAAITKDGSTFLDRFGQPKESPHVQIEHRARNDFRALCREIGLDFVTDEQRQMRRDRTYGGRA